jgi:hypothetical protein
LLAAVATAAVRVLSLTLAPTFPHIHVLRAAAVCCATCMYAPVHTAALPLCVYYAAHFLLCVYLCCGTATPVTTTQLCPLTQCFCVPIETVDSAGCARVVLSCLDLRRGACITPTSCEAVTLGVLLLRKACGTAPCCCGRLFDCNASGKAVCLCHRGAHLGWLRVVLSGCPPQSTSSHCHCQHNSSSMFLTAPASFMH